MWGMSVPELAIFEVSIMDLCLSTGISVISPHYAVCLEFAVSYPRRFIRLRESVVTGGAVVVWVHLVCMA